MIINLSIWGSGGGSGGGVTEDQAAQIAFNTIQEELQDNGGTIHDADMVTAENVKTELRKDVIKEQFNGALDNDFHDGTIITVPKGSDLMDFSGEKWHHDKFVVDSRTNNIPSVADLEDTNPLSYIENANYFAFIRNQSKEVAGQTYHGISLSVPQSIAGDFEMFYMHGHTNADGSINLNFDETPYEFGTEVDFEAGGDVIVFYNYGGYSANGFTKVIDPYDFTTNEYSHFTVGRPVDLAGTILGLLSIDAYAVNKIKDWSFAYLFENQSNIINASNLSLFEAGRDDGMFNYYVGKHAFSHIFKGCTGLETFNHYAFCVMSGRGGYCGLDDSALSAFFEGCTSLTTAPELPTDLVSKYTYDYMFKGCTSLTTVPSVLPATRLDLGTYRGMFYGCTSLTKAPVLPNPSDNSTIPSEAYNFMFDGCTSLSKIKTFFTSATTLDNTNAQNWLNGIAASGTYLGVDNTYVPAGWTYLGPNDGGWGEISVSCIHSDPVSLLFQSRPYEQLYINGQSVSFRLPIPYNSNTTYEMWLNENMYVVADNVENNKYVVDIYYKNGESVRFGDDYSTDPFAYVHYPSIGDVDFRPIVKDEEWLKLGDEWYYRGDANNHAYSADEVEVFATTIQTLWNDYKITSRRESDGAIYNGSWQEAITTQNQGGCVCLKKGDLWANSQILSVIVVDSQNNNALTIYNNPSQVMYNTITAIINNTPEHIAGYLIQNTYYPDQYNRWRIYISYEGSFLEAHIEVDPEAATLYPGDRNAQAYNCGMLVASGYNAKLGGDVLVIIKKDNGNLVTAFAGLKKDYEKIVVGNAQSYTIWNGTQAEYDALTSYDANKIYLIQ